MTLALIVGIWTTTCIQTQIAGNNQGFAIESYEFTQEGSYEFTREWYSDSACSEFKGKENEKGSLKLGRRMSGMFISGETFEADFTTHEGAKDLGAISVKEGHSIKVARGIKGSSFRNSMLGVFEYLRR